MALARTFWDPQAPTLCTLAAELEDEDRWQVTCLGTRGQRAGVRIKMQPPLCRRSCPGMPFLP